MSIERLAGPLAGRYTIERELGQGGMATVYLAHDVRHERYVALKVLRPELAAILGGDRFLKEIRTTANLQHPHILALHDSGEADGLVYYVMPYIEGESLRDRLNREKQLPVDDAVRIAREVADALEYAHQHGVIHRDIKPENILLHGGHAMVADFGIALAAARSEGGTRMTETGMSLGTPAYMAPEQAMGEREITPRADVYALGCVLYEMLTGEPPFNGPTAQAIVARMMTESPRSLTMQRHTIPPFIEAAAAKALERLPADRFATAAQFSEALARDTGMRSPAFDRLTATRAVPAKYRPSAVLFLAAIALLVGGLLFATRSTPKGDLLELQFVPGPDHRLGGSYGGNLAVSHDGQMIAYIADAEGGRHLNLRRLGSFAPIAVAGTEGIFSDPAFSPDDRDVAFGMSDGSIRRVSLIGAGQPTTVATSSVCCTLQWAPEGILYSSGRGLELVPASGGASRVLAPIGFPGVGVLLPGGRAVVYLNFRGSRFFEALDLKKNVSHPLEGLPTGASDIEWADGYLVAHSGTNLVAVPFDLGTLKVTGPPITIMAQVRAGVSGGFIETQTAIGGATLAFVPATGNNRVVFVDRSGHETMLPDTTGTFHRPRFSADGRRISMDVNRPEGRDVWVYDLDQKTLTRLTFQPNAHDAIWAPDGSIIYAAAVSDTLGGLFRRRLDGSSTVDTLATGIELDAAEAVTANGEILAYAITTNSHTDAWLITPHGGHRALLNGEFDESGFALSPDHRWLAYVSDESGRREVYVRPVAGGERLQVSTAGGREALWAPSGHELFYRSRLGSGARLMSAQLSLTPLRVIRRDTLFGVSDYEESDPHGNFDVSPRGDRFVFIRQQMPNEIRVVRNWKNLLRK